MHREKVPSGNRWEPIIGFSRAIKVNNHIFVSGTTAVDAESNVIGLNDPYKQTIYILKKIETALQELGAKISDVVRTRIYTTNIDYWDEIGKAHGEFFQEVRPASTIIQVDRLIVEDMLVEIEVECILT
ncbi:MAG: RidA family protein [Verrucomicrobia bacterium]|nr:RidA family protein [Verrucomicrobiota bacterium]